MYYKHSGQFNLGGLAIGAATGSVAALILAYAYGRGLILISEVHFAAFATLAFGGLVGLATGYGMVWGKVRNQPVTIAVTAVTSTLALYLSWAVWVQFTLEAHDAPSWTQLAQNPNGLWNLICAINQYGTWGTDGGAATTGWELWGIWLLEAATVIGVAIFAAIGVLNRRPFCEACGSWCTRGAKMTLGAPANVAQLKLQLEATDLRALENLGPANKGGDHLIAVLDNCEHCRQLHTMTLTLVTIRRDKLRRTRIHKKIIVQHLLLGPGQADTLRQLSMKLSQAAAAMPKANAAATGKR